MSETTHSAIHDRSPDLGDPMPVPLLDANSIATDAELGQQLLAMLLVAAEPATLTELALGASVAVDRVEAVIRQLQNDSTVPWLVVQHGVRIELTTHPRHAALVRRFLKQDRETRLSPAALETLAVVAYRQPVTRGEIESVRGVDCSGVLSTLLARGLVESTGRARGLGAPLSYGTTAAFLHHFGLTSIEQLPPLGSFEGSDVGELLRKRASDTATTDGAHDRSSS